MAQATDTDVRQQVLQSITDLWWLPLVRGVLLILLACYALFRPGMLVTTFAMVFGIFLIFDGILAIIAGVMGSVPSRFWTIVRGVAAIVLGLFAVGNAPIVAIVGVTTILILIAILAIALGGLEIYAAIRDRNEIEGEGWMILGGTLTVLFGVLLLLAPMQLGPLFIRILGVYAIFFGVSSILFAFRLRGLGKRVSQKD